MLGGAICYMKSVVLLESPHLAKSSTGGFDIIIWQGSSSHSGASFMGWEDGSVEEIPC